VHLNKGGFVFVMDKRDGKLENVWRFSKNVNWVDSIDPKTGELIGRHDHVMGEAMTQCPASSGGRQWNAGAYSPRTKLWYVTAFEVCMTWTPTRVDATKLPLAQAYTSIGREAFRRRAVCASAPSMLGTPSPARKMERRLCASGLRGRPGHSRGSRFNEDAEGMRAHDAVTGKDHGAFGPARGGDRQHGATDAKYSRAERLRGYASMFGPQWFPDWLGSTAAPH
jgi:alcohol dehydrogenase (cytochrome c)